MMKIPEKVRRQLKKPLGRLCKDFKEVKELSRDHRIIAIGDVCTLGLLAMGIEPQLAVFDFHLMRREIDPQMRAILKTRYPKPKTYKNPAGMLSDKILKDAGKLMKKGGAVYIDGEEDLTALAFMLHAGPKEVIVYGQPNMGIVIVRPDDKLKKKIKKWLE